MIFFMEDLWKLVEQSGTIAISGHVKPDGDCIGSTLAMYLYIQENFNSDGRKTVDWFLEEPPKEFGMLHGIENVDTTFEKTIEGEYDLYLALDSGSLDRLGSAIPMFEAAAHTFCIDHHISNTSYAEQTVVWAETSSTSEVLYHLMDAGKISLDTAEALYTGIVHDTGVFRYSCTSPETMRVVAALMEKGVRTNALLEETFYERTYVQNQILGRSLLESFLLLDGRVIVSGVTLKTLKFYNGTSADIEGVVELLRSTKGVEVSIFLREEAPMQYKVSLRSDRLVDVSRIAVLFGGGGHVRAAGCTMNGTWRDVVNNLTVHIEDQLRALNSADVK